MKYANKQIAQDLASLMKSTAIELVDVAIGAGPIVVRRDNDSIVSSYSEKGIKLAGFASVTDEADDLGFYADVIAANEGSHLESMLRISGIVYSEDNERTVFNSITINFTINELLSDKLLYADAPIEYSDIKELIADKKTKAISIRCSDQAKSNNNDDKRSGKFYEIELSNANKANNDLFLLVNDAGIERSSNIAELSESLSQATAFLAASSKR